MAYESASNLLRRIDSLRSKGELFDPEDPGLNDSVLEFYDLCVDSTLLTFQGQSLFEIDCIGAAELASLNYLKNRAMDAYLVRGSLNGKTLSGIIADYLVEMVSTEKKPKRPLINLYYDSKRDDVYMNFLFFEGIAESGGFYGLDYTGSFKINLKKGYDIKENLLILLNMLFKVPYFTVDQQMAGLDDPADLCTVYGFNPGLERKVPIEYKRRLGLIEQAIRSKVDAVFTNGQVKKSQNLGKKVAVLHKTKTSRILIMELRNSLNSCLKELSMLYNPLERRMVNTGSYARSDRTTRDELDLLWLYKYLKVNLENTVNFIDNNAHTLAEKIRIRKRKV